MLRFVDSLVSCVGLHIDFQIKVFLYCWYYLSSYVYFYVCRLDVSFYGYCVYDFYNTRSSSLDQG